MSKVDDLEWLIALSGVMDLGGAAMLFAGNRSNTRRALHKGEQRGSIYAARRPTLLPASIHGPLGVFAPDTPTDDGMISKMCQHMRKRRAVPTTLEVWLPTSELRVRFGLPARTRHDRGARRLLMHDAGVGRVLAYIFTHGERDDINHFVPEDAVPQRDGRPHPDGFIVKDGKVRKVIEYGGYYPAARIRQLVDYWTRRGVIVEVY